jgi:hypothetical protein
MLGDDRVKIVYKDWKRILLVTENTEPNTADWKTLTKKQAKEY